MESARGGPSTWVPSTPLADAVRAEPVDIATLPPAVRPLEPDESSQARALLREARAAIAKRRWRDDEALERRLLDLHRPAYGADHPVVAELLGRVAHAQERQGKITAAEPLRREALAIDRAQLGESHPITAQMFNDLAVNLTRQARHAEAEPLYRAALDARRAAAVPPFTIAASEVALAANLQRQRRFAEGESLARQALDRQSAALGGGDLRAKSDYANMVSSVADSYHLLAQILSAQGRSREAKVACRQGRALQMAGDRPFYCGAL